MEHVFENLTLYLILIIVGVVIFKVSKTVISMVIGFVILVAVGLLVWFIYKFGLSEVPTDSGYFVVFVKGVEILLSRLKELMI